MPDVMCEGLTYGGRPCPRVGVAHRQTLAGRQWLCIRHAAKLTFPTPRSRVAYNDKPDHSVMPAPMPPWKRGDPMPEPDKVRGTQVCIQSKEMQSLIAQECARRERHAAFLRALRWPPSALSASELAHVRRHVL